MSLKSAEKTLGKLGQKLVLRFTLFALLLFCFGCNFNQPETYDALLKGLYKKTVPFISAEELQEQLQQEPQTILLDTRSLPEFQVSHLAGANFLDYANFSKEAVKNWPRHKPIIVYCSVGYRSERIGEELQQLGFTNVKNLHRGIFGWVNEARPVYNFKGQTTAIHPYSKKWGKWLQKGKKTYEPE